MRNIVYQSTLPISYPLPILMRVSYNTLIVKQNTSDYYKYTKMKANHNCRETVRCGRLAVSNGSKISK